MPTATFLFPSFIFSQHYTPYKSQFCASAVIENLHCIISKNLKVLLSKYMVNRADPDSANSLHTLNLVYTVCSSISIHKFSLKMVIMRNNFTFGGGNFIKLFWFPFEKVSILKGKNCRIANSFLLE